MDAREIEERRVNKSNVLSNLMDRMRKERKFVGTTAVPCHLDDLV